MKYFYAVVAAALLYGPGAASAMGLSFSWGPTAKCFDPKSPPMSVSSVPKGTAKLKFRMVDLNAPGFSHGGGTVEYKGSGKIAYGTFRYRGRARHRRMCTSSPSRRSTPRERFWLRRPRGSVFPELTRSGHSGLHRGPLSDWPEIHHARQELRRESG